MSVEQERNDGRTMTAVELLATLEWRGRIAWALDELLHGSSEDWARSLPASDDYDSPEECAMRMVLDPATLAELIAAALRERGLVAVAIKSGAVAAWRKNPLPRQEEDAFVAVSEARSALARLLALTSNAGPNATLAALEAP